MFFSDLLNKQFKVSIACVDISSKYAVVIAIKSKKKGDVAAGILERLIKRKNTPTSMGVRDENHARTF